MTVFTSSKTTTNNKCSQNVALIITKTCLIVNLLRSVYDRFTTLGTLYAGIRIRPSTFADVCAPQIVPHLPSIMGKTKQPKTPKKPSQPFKKSKGTPKSKLKVNHTKFSEESKARARSRLQVWKEVSPSASLLAFTAC